LNGSEIESAEPGEIKVATFDFQGQSRLEVRELNTSIIQINTFELTNSEEGVTQLYLILPKLNHD
jgi:hypothetical protein